jgi:hypothetical protein
VKVELYGLAEIVAGLILQKEHWMCGMLYDTKQIKTTTQTAKPAQLESQRPLSGWLRRKTSLWLRLNDVRMTSKLRADFIHAAHNTKIGITQRYTR